MSKPIKVLSISALLSALILSFVFLPELKESLFHDKENSTKEENDLLQTAQLLQLHRPHDALVLIKKYQNHIDDSSDQGKRWLNYLVKAAEQLPDSEQLRHVFNFNSEALQNHETAALIVANQLIAERDWKNYEKLRQQFDDSKNKDAWSLLDADSLILQGKNLEAVKNLKSHYTEGNFETERLLRLALLHLNDHPKVAWGYLEQAYKKDPQNSDIRFYRARLLETVNKKDLATAEFNALGNHAHSSAWLKGELLDFYLREHDFKKAEQVLEKNLSHQMSPTSSLNALFLSKAISPLPFNFSKNMDSSNSLNLFLADLPSDQFWNEEAFAKSGEANSFAQNEQAVFWLRILQNLNNRREADALTLLEHAPIQNALWDTELATMLERIIRFRQLDTLALPQENLALLKDQDTLPEFFKEINKATQNDPTLTKNPALKDYLKESQIYSSIFLARGWNEAAIRLQASPVLSQISPDWVAPLFTKALRENRGIKEALAFAKLQNQTDTLKLLSAELLLENQEFAQAETELLNLAKEIGTPSKKAAWIMATRYSENKAWSDAKHMLALQPEVQNSVKGQELLAEIALEENDKEKAKQIYMGIEASSFEAKSFMAKQAFEEKNYRKAYLLTEELLKESPNNKQLQYNLKLIMNEINAVD